MCWSGWFHWIPSWNHNEAGILNQAAKTTAYGLFLPVLALNFTVDLPARLTTRALFLRRLRSNLASFENEDAINPPTTMRKNNPRTIAIGFSKFMSKGAAIQ